MKDRDFARVLHGDKAQHHSIRTWNFPYCNTLRGSLIPTTQGSPPGGDETTSHTSKKQPINLFSKGISIPPSSLAHYPKHCLVPGQHAPMTVVPARGESPVPSPPCPDSAQLQTCGTATSLTAATQSPCTTAPRDGFCVPVISHGPQLDLLLTLLQTSPLRPENRWSSRAPQGPPSPARLPDSLCAGLPCTAAFSTQQLGGRCTIQPPNRLWLHLSNGFPSHGATSPSRGRRVQRNPCLAFSSLGPLAGCS